ncbi:hypothetical protein FA13DRAFT_600629 [Coprinellus micaceus]|uniref:Uncharacterized protein n=1 Tax=Coprinellus micaceus TaxID=71717 RepID=A0A4Y7T7B8_COPMI|nr:hypothetical protein FA13DRAFT_600629 [Coprinellus micaceus]
MGKESGLTWVKKDRRCQGKCSEGLNFFDGGNDVENQLQREVRKHDPTCYRGSGKWASSHIDVNEPPPLPARLCVLVCQAALCYAIVNAATFPTRCALTIHFISRKVPSLEIMGHHQRSFTAQTAIPGWIGTLGEVSQVDRKRNRWALLGRLFP